MRDYLVTVYEQTARVAMVKLSLGDDSEREDAEAAAIREAQRNPAMWSSLTTDYYGDVEDVTPRPGTEYSIENLQHRANDVWETARQAAADAMLRHRTGGSK